MGAIPLVSALQLVQGHYDIYDVDTLVAILRSPHDASQVADLIDGSRALIDATAGTAHIRVQAEPTTATVGMATEHGVATRDVASMATFSTTGARMVSSQVQCNVRMVQREVQATRVVRDASASATINTADASTCHKFGCRHWISARQHADGARARAATPARAAKGKATWTL